MKLIFDASLPYQQEAIQAAIGVFEGQPSNQSQFEVSFTTQMDMLEQTELGIGNRLTIDTGRILENTHTVQETNDIPKSRLLLEEYEQNGYYAFPNFSVEMETGTGKTYVYLRGIFELNQKYGFKKFIIVVPSVAIREGVLKSIEITKEHFAGIYDNVPFDYFVYDSKKLGKVRQFATGNQIQVMVINIQAFQKDAGDDVDYSKLDDEQRKKLNIIHQERDAMSHRDH